MKKLKKAFRLLGFVMFLLLASFGLGMQSIFANKERYLDNEIRIEQTSKKEDEENEDFQENKS